MALPHRKHRSALRQFLDNQSSAGLVLIAAAAAALIIGNSPLAPAYEAALHTAIGPLSLLHWINDGFMTLFFLLVGLEIKREMLDGQLSTWPRRMLPGLAAAGGMAVPALIYIALNDGAALNGWAIPAATDIAFALGVLSLLGDRAPASLRIFLAALAIIDDLGAVIIIALFYTPHLSTPDLGAALMLVALLALLNLASVRRLAPYLMLGALLWVFILRSGVHATLAGVLLALTIPMDRTPARTDSSALSPLHRLEHSLHIPVGFLIVPLFAFANAGVPILRLGTEALLAPVTLGVAAGLLIGKPLGVFGFSMLAIRLGLADAPAHASRTQMIGVALICGIGFTMSLFIALLAFPAYPTLQAEAKIGIIAGSLLSGLIGYAVLRFARRTGPVRSAPQIADR